MAIDITNHKCPACTGPLHFVGASGMLECDYCGSKYSIEEIEKLYAQDVAEAEEGFAKNEAKKEKEKAEFEAMGMEWSEEEAKGMKTYSCPSCGAELICDATTAATSCPYCGNPTVIPGQFTGGLKPDLVIPFKLNKDQAVKALEKHYKGKIFLPKAFKEHNHIEEIKGVYVPFWLFDTDVDAQMRYSATKVRTWSDDDYDYKETSHFAISREGKISFEHVPVDGSSKMANDLMESIEPYNFSDAVDFKTAYLAGYLADKYDVGAEESMERANARVKESTERAFADTVNGYNTVSQESSSIQLSNGNAKYALYPVWLLNTTWNGNKYTFAMNGQTGKFVGDLPIDKSAAMKWFIALAAGIGAGLYALAWILHLTGIL